MRRALQTALVCILGVVMLGAGTSADRYGRMGHQMMCVCGCGQILLECNHVGCPDSARMIGELQDQLAGPNSAGADSLIMNWFVAKYGATVLAAPLRGGFDTVAWIVPLTVFVLSIVGTGLLVRAWARRRQPALEALAGAGSAHPDRALLSRIRRETEY